MASRIHARAFHEPIMAAGLVPPHCKLLDVIVGVDGAMSVIYEAFLDIDQIEKLGAIFVDVARRHRADDERNVAANAKQDESR
jgi:hypothetical protein